ncbi:MAG: NAD-dependent epimerase/dehydratase family protein [Verrucomicrobia bacterium]|nr:NAD-dependent epimerase/dehydratase family protein [Verrucomicrobiota bacterium]
MRILFIGGTGNLSADCAELLHRRGHEVVLLTRGRSLAPPQYRSVVADRKETAAMRAALANVVPDVVINFLGYELADVQLDHALFAGSVRQYVFISTAAAYVKPSPRLPITEETPLGNAFWDYAQKKEQCENWLRERWLESRFPVTIVRPSHTYSPRWFPNPVSSSGYTFAARLETGKPVFVPGDGENPWTLTATSDFAVGVAGLVGNDATVGEVFHITSDEALTWNQIYAQTAAALGVKSPRVLKIPVEFICQHCPRLTGTLKGDKTNPAIFDNSKIKRFVPEFQCRKPFRAGIRESVEWFRQHPDRKQVNPDADAAFDQVTAAWMAQGGK